jgi:hypothetical protein
VPTNRSTIGCGDGRSLDSVFGRRRRIQPSPLPDPAAAPADPIATLLDERMSALEAELISATGDGSLCAISKSGGQVDGAKYLEGRMAALMELRHRHHNGGEIGDLVTSMTTAWSDELDAVRERAAGRGWIAYRAGGVDELTEFAALL